MVITLDFPPDIAAQLKEMAQAQKIPVAELAYQFVVDGLAENHPDQAEGQTLDEELEQLVREVQAMPPNPDSVIPAEGSLLEALQNSSSDPDLDLAT